MSGNEPLPVWLCGAMILGASAGLWVLVLWLLSVVF